MEINRNKPSSPPVQVAPPVAQAQDARERAAALAEASAKSRQEEAARMAQNKLRQQVNGQGQTVGTRLNEVV